jgi:tetratricopeptide (TPR) repeat protein
MNASFCTTHADARLCNSIDQGILRQQRHGLRRNAVAARIRQVVGFLLRQLGSAVLEPAGEATHHTLRERLGGRWLPRRHDSAALHKPGHDTRFYRSQLLRLAMPWRYVGVLHEVASCDGAGAAGRIEGPVTYGRFDGARNQDKLEKYRQDIVVLDKALKQDPKNARYAFYLAQSYRDSQDSLRAEHCYRKRADMGGWEEEVWYSLYQIGVLRERMNRPTAQILEAHLEAFNFRPSRAEPLVALARYFRNQRQYASCLVFAQAAMDMPKPKDILYLDRGAYDWRARDEYAIATYWLGMYEESLRESNRLLAPKSGLPESQRERVEKNRRFALQKQAPSQSLSDRQAG